MPFFRYSTRHSSRWRISLYESAALGFVLAISFALTLPAAAQTPPQTLRQAGEARHIIVGTAADPAFLSEPEYAAILGSEFSGLEGENQMKFEIIHPRPDSDANPYDFLPGDALVAFAQSHNMVVRGHTLVWHNQIPDWVKNGKYSSRRLKGILRKHIRTVMGHYASKIYAWDVVNEAFSDDGTMRSTTWYDKPGIGAGKGTKYVEQALRWAYKADPHVKLFYNDYNTETINKKSDAVYAMVADFKRRGVPLDGVGFQSHIDLSFDTPENLESFAKNLERFAKLGLEINITELDIRLKDGSDSSLAAQAKLYREIASVCVQQPACKLLQTWGFTDKHSWIPGFFKGQGWGLPWDANYQKKPAYEALRQALAK